jgi:iron only hydrogenase large subunit-like protein
VYESSNLLKVLTSSTQFLFELKRLIDQKLGQVAKCKKIFFKAKIDKIFDVHFSVDSYYLSEKKHFSFLQFFDLTYSF